MISANGVVGLRIAVAQTSSLVKGLELSGLGNLPCPTHTFCDNSGNNMDMVGMVHCPLSIDKKKEKELKILLGKE